MYLTKTNTLAVKAMKATLDADYPEEDFRDTFVSLEFPVAEQSIPAIWVTFDPIGPLRPVGVGYYEDTVSGQGVERATRWSFAGNIIYTMVAMTSLERDRLFDQVVSILAFGQFDPERSAYRTAMETDPLIQISVNFDEIDQRGFTASPGTPWGTSDVMYECSLSVQCLGEFVSASGTDTLLPISAINLISWNEQFEVDPTVGTWLG